MKRIAIALTMLLSGFASAQSNLLEEIAAQILGDRFGLDIQDIFRVQDQTDEEIWDLGPTLAMSRYGHSNASDVDRMRESGMGWGEIAKEIGMHPGTFNKLRKQGYFDREEFWDDVVHRRYDYRESDLDWIRNHGGTDRDVLCSAIVAKSSNRRPTEVFQRFQSTKNWDRTADSYRVNLKNWKSKGKKVGWEGASKPSGVTKQSSAKSKAKATGSTKSKGKGSDKTVNAKGKGKSGTAKGKGNTKGQSKGKGKGSG